MAVYALTIFIGAFLLFQVQPLIGKYILPWFGGGPGVWTTCMLFFQVVLLGGYAYAHVLSSRLKPRAQVIVHALLLVAALALLPITPADTWKPQGGENPTWHILALLTISLGLPYFVLSSTGPLVQQWFSLSNPGRSPYRLYALSNAGSLLALLSYPFYFETHFTRKAQAGLWAAGLVVYAICCTLSALKLWKITNTNVLTPAKPADISEGGNESAGANGGGSTTPSCTPGQRTLWLLLPACASVLLLATTNKMCQDVAVIPFLWVLPLALYLLSFIICFDSPRWYVRFPFTLTLIAALGGICWVMTQGTDLSIYKHVGVYSAGLFICCMVCHGELYRLRPDPRHLTAFYLMVAAGGALGGLFVAVGGPSLFTDYTELHWGLFVCAFLFLVVCVRDRSPAEARKPLWNEWRWLACTLPLIAFGALDYVLTHLRGEFAQIPKAHLLSVRIILWAFLAISALSWILRGNFRTFRHWKFLTCLWLTLGVGALGTVLWNQGRKPDNEVVYKSRNFYGILTVYEHRKDEPEGHHILLQHGRITHGFQFCEPQQTSWLTTYYGEESGIGAAMRALPSGFRHIGLVGLGTGTLTAYAEPGDYFRIYEINPEVKQLATSRFSFISNCPAQVEVVLGDARLSMERESPQHFDLLALDAFSSDAIPVHLLTKEAFETYERHLKTNGIIAVHVSNHYLDLEPVVANLARQFHYQAALMDYEENEEQWWLYSSTWILLTRNAEILNSPSILQVCSNLKTNAVQVPLWTDDFTSLFQILK